MAILPIITGLSGPIRDSARARGLFSPHGERSVNIFE
jgi:hypothetical protein